MQFFQDCMQFFQDFMQFFQVLGTQYFQVFGNFFKLTQQAKPRFDTGPANPWVMNTSFLSMREKFITYTQTNIF